MRLLIVIFLSLVCAKAEPLRVSVTHMPVSASAVLAKQRGLFKNAGLEVEFREYELGKTALEDLSSGKLDVAFAAVTPVVHKCLSGVEFRILGTVASSPTVVALAGRKDQGVEKPSDMRGKRVGLVTGTSGEFFFDTMRVFNRLPKDSVIVVDLPLQGLMDGIRNGSLDVVSIWEPQIQELKISLTNRLALFYGEGLYTFSWNMTVLPKTINVRREDLEKFVSVLMAAGDSIEDDPSKAAADLAPMGALGRHVTIGLKETRFRPQIGQELLVQMEGEARWILNRDGKSNAAPNFLRWIDTSVLKKAAPAAVTVIQ